MPSDTRKVLIDTLEFVQQVTVGLLKDFPEQHLTSRACPTDNPVIWSVGHLASVNDWFASLIDGRATEFPRAWQTACGYKSTPSGDIAAYPAFGELRATLERAHSRLVEAVRALSRRAWKLVWLTPLAGDSGYVPQTAAISAIAPILDRLGNGSGTAAICEEILTIARAA